MALSFAEKNRLLVRYKDPQYFYKDLNLFKVHYPGHKLNNELANVSAFNKSRLSEQMLLLLLDKVPVDTILENRGIQPQRELTFEEKTAKVIAKYGEDYIIKNTTELKDIASILGQPEPESLASYAPLVGKTIRELFLENDEDDSDDLDEDEDLDEDLDEDEDPDNDPNSLKSIITEHNENIETQSSSGNISAKAQDETEEKPVEKVKSEEKPGETLDESQEKTEKKTEVEEKVETKDKVEDPATDKKKETKTKNSQK